MQSTPLAERAPGDNPLAQAQKLPGLPREMLVPPRFEAPAWGLVVVLPLIHFATGIPLWHCALIPGRIGPGRIVIRICCEHQWADNPNGRTIIVERSVLAPLFLFNNLHFVHHKLPHLPWYRLPATYRAIRSDWQRMNDGYILHSYFSVSRKYGWQMKAQVSHPVWRRHKTDGDYVG